MNYSDIQEVIYTWVVSETSYNHVIWERANAPRPERPYIGLLVIAIAPIGYTDLSPVNDSGILNIYGQSQLTLTINAYDKEEPSKLGAIDELNKLMLSLDKQSVRAIFEDKNIGFQNFLTLQNLEQLLGTGFEQRATMDLLFNVSTSIEDDVGLIEKVFIDSEYLNTAGQEIYKGQIEVQS